MPGGLVNACFHSFALFQWEVGQALGLPPSSRSCPSACNVYMTTCTIHSVRQASLHAGLKRQFRLACRVQVGALHRPSAHAALAHAAPAQLATAVHDAICCTPAGAAHSVCSRVQLSAKLLQVGKQMTRVACVPTDQPTCSPCLQAADVQEAEQDVLVNVVFRSWSTSSRLVKSSQGV